MDNEELVGGGWSALNKVVRNPDPKEQEEINRAGAEQFDMDLAYLRCFQTADGVAVLEDLKKKYILVNSYDPGKVNPDQHGHFFEGHRNLVLILMQRMERAKMGSPVDSRRVEL